MIDFARLNFAMDRHVTRDWDKVAARQPSIFEGWVSSLSEFKRHSSTIGLSVGVCIRPSTSELNYLMLSYGASLYENGDAAIIVADFTVWQRLFKEYPTQKEACAIFLAFERTFPDAFKTDYLDLKEKRIYHAGS